MYVMFGASAGVKPFALARSCGCCVVGMAARYILHSERGADVAPVGSVSVSGLAVSRYAEDVGHFVRYGAGEERACVGTH